jgi:hypothetical protein
MESIGIQALMVNNRRIFVRLEGDTEDGGDSCSPKIMRLLNIDTIKTHTKIYTYKFS